ncbi:hypothetical protein AB205_0184330 [Aquarana catesbeiana]|uniref:Uncharacterized protein n=1 Tax=Aquarana catesbeiana TaxID=8400 RepID=A0A2G9RSY8_AQUCT|nr:hypothetical protein AB205_0184330 [Aquarana catesbeiana]
MHLTIYPFAITAKHASQYKLLAIAANTCILVFTHLQSLQNTHLSIYPFLQSLQNVHLSINSLQSLQNTHLSIYPFLQLLQNMHLSRTQYTLFNIHASQYKLLAIVAKTRISAYTHLQSLQTCISTYTPCNRCKHTQWCSHSPLNFLVAPNRSLVSSGIHTNYSSFSSVFSPSSQSSSGSILYQTGRYFPGKKE